MYAVVGILVLFSCQKSDKTAETSEPVPAIADRYCGTQEVLQQQLAEDPTLAARMAEIESFTEAYRRKAKTSPRTGPITIPVFVHVVYNTPAQNISLAQIQSQIKVLNQDFSASNTDNNNVSQTEFKTVNGNMDIQFTLAGVRTVTTSKKSFGTDDGVKYSKRGGDDAVDPSKYLNIWVCNLGQNLLGYAQFPGGKAATDGVVILYSAFGSKKEYPQGTYTTNYDLGRTATHEIGHWLNLRHIWGDATCGNDQVDDTPPHKTANYRCPDPIEITCPVNTTGFTHEMTMNYMDYTYDGCMYMFTAGQKLRVDAALAGSRASFARY